MKRLLLILAILTAPAVGQAQEFILGNCEAPMCWQEATEFNVPQEASCDSQLLDFYRLRIANLERQVQVYEANDAEQQRIIASQGATIKMWENRSSGKVTKKEWAVLVLSVVAAVGTVVGR